MKAIDLYKAMYGCEPAPEVPMNYYDIYGFGFAARHFGYQATIQATDIQKAKEIANEMAVEFAWNLFNHKIEFETFPTATEFYEEYDAPADDWEKIDEIIRLNLDVWFNIVVEPSTRVNEKENEL